MAIGPGGLEVAYRNAAITCAAMAASTLFYAGVVEVISVFQAPFEGFAGQSQAPMLRVSLWAVAAVEVGLIGLVRRALFTRARAEAAGRQPGRLIAAAVITAAMAEAPAILGLVLFMVSGLRSDFYVLFALSLALQAVYFPRLDGWRQWAAAPGA